MRFIIIGGVAASAHGAARATYDIDIVYSRDPENIRRLVAAGRPKDFEAIAELQAILDERRKQLPD